MTSHIHLIIGTNGNPLSDIIRDWKAFTSRHIRKCLEAATFESRKVWMLRVLKYKEITNSKNKDFQLWQQNNHPIVLDSNYLINQKVEYIHNNPVAAGLSEKPVYWLHSSASFYYEENGLSFIHLTRIA